MARTKKSTEGSATAAQSLGNLIKSCRDIMRKDKGLNGDLDRLPMLTWVLFLKFLDDLEQMRETEATLEGKRYRPAIEAPYRWRDWAAQPDGITGDALIAFINHDEAIRPDGTRGPGLFATLRSLTGGQGTDRRDVIRSVFTGTSNRMLNGYLLRDMVNKVNGIHFTSSEEISTLGHLYESMLKEMRDAAGDSGEFYTPRALVKFIVTVTDPRLGETVLDPACGTGGFLTETFEHLKKQCRTTEDHSRLQHETLFGVEAKPLPYLLCQMNLLLHGLESPQIDPHNALRHKLGEIGDRDRVDVILTNPPFGGEEQRGILGNFPADKQTSETALLFLQLIMRRLRRQPRPGRAAVVVPESVMSDKGVAGRIRRELVEEFNLHTILRLPKGVFEPYSDIQTNVLFFDRSSDTKGTWFYEHTLSGDRGGMRNPCYTRSMPLRFEELEAILDWWPRRVATSRAWYVPVGALSAAEWSFDFRNPQSREAITATPNQIVTSITAPLDHSLDIVRKLKDAGSVVESVDAGSWPKRPLRDLLTQSRVEAEIDNASTYKQITVRLYGKGAVLRGVLGGAAIRTRPQFVARAGQLIMSRIDARNGAFAIVPPELDGAVVTQDFPLFDLNRDVLQPEFLPVLLRSHGFLEACGRASRGTTNRKRLKEGALLDERVAVPEKRVQEEVIAFVSLLSSLDEQVAALKEVVDLSIPSFASQLFT